MKKVMANSAWSEKVVQLLRRMNSFYFPGAMRTLVGQRT